jgi:hypothetical protein
VGGSGAKPTKPEPTPQPARGFANPFQ